MFFLQYSSEDCYYTTSPASHHPNDHNVSQKWDPPLSSNIVFDARRPMAVMGQRSRLVFTKISYFKRGKICDVFIRNVSDFIVLLVCDIFSIFFMLQTLHKNCHTSCEVTDSKWNDLPFFKMFYPSLRMHKSCCVYIKLPN